jgi:hypothetical protein
MTALQQARKAVFGETWALPLLVAALLAAALVIRAAVPGFWENVGGPLLLAGTIAVFIALTRPER